MRAVRNTVGGVALIDVEPPRGEGVRVRVTAAGICGSDLHAVAAGLSKVTLGHEFGGRLDDGRLVAVRPMRSCGRCQQCSGGLRHLCRHNVRRFYGASLDGGLAEEVLVHPECLIEVPGTVAPSAISLVEPLAVAVHATNRAAIEFVDRALVIGGGTIGLLVAAVLVDLGIRVDIVARHDAQRVAADAIGARFDLATEYDVVFDAAGTTESLAQAVDLAKRGGEVVFVALPWSETRLPIAAIFKEVSIVPAVFYGDYEGSDEFGSAAELLGRSPWIESAIVTHRFRLEDAATAFQVAGDRRAGAIKVVFDLND